MLGFRVLRFFGKSHARKEEEVLRAGSVCLFPGNLTNPKRVTYPGEDRDSLGFRGLVS